MTSKNYFIILATVSFPRSKPLPKKADYGELCEKLKETSDLSSLNILPVTKICAKEAWLSVCTKRNKTFLLIGDQTSFFQYNLNPDGEIIPWSVKMMKSAFVKPIFTKHVVIWQEKTNLHIQAVRSKKLVTLTKM